MTLFHELWKKFQTTLTQKHSVPPVNFLKKESKKTEIKYNLPLESQNLESQNKEATQILNNVQHIELESLEQEKLISKIELLKKLVDQPKEEMPEFRSNQIKQNLGPAEAHETIRQERWPKNIHCPLCHSHQLKRLPPLASQSQYNHRYQCLSCNHIFNDDTGTPMEHGVPALDVWMHCWYLMGCTDSISFIANKLGLDITTVERMMEQLRTSFLAQKPLTRFIGFDTWNKQSQQLRAQLKEDLLRQYELLDANVATVPKDTAEYRRQQSIRRDPNTGGRKR